MAAGDRSAMIASAEQVPDVSKALDIAREQQPPTGPTPRLASESSTVTT